MAETIRILIILILTGITLPALLGSLVFLIPNRVQAVEAVLQQRPRRAFIVGFINVLFFGLIVTIFSNEGDQGGFIAFLIVLFLLALAMIGLASFVTLLRAKFYGATDLPETLKTAVLLIIALLTPVVGWFILTPILFIMSIGAALITLFRRKKKES